MSRTVTIGNGNLLVGLDEHAQVRDFYFPFAGHANHVSGASGSYTHRVGVWVDNVLYWLNHDSWRIIVLPDSDTPLQSFQAVNEKLGISLIIRDVVHNEHNVYIRQVKITNMTDRTRAIKIFFAQEFRIAESRRGDTAFFDPRINAIVHYKGHVAFVVYAMTNGVPFNEYSVGLFGIEGKEGSYLDAEDGKLSCNTIEHGSVDSVIGLEGVYQAREQKTVHYWIAAGQSVRDAHALHALVLHERPEPLVDSTARYWHAWVKKEGQKFHAIDQALQDLYERSLMVIRVHTDNRGGIIASSDSDILNQGRDTYSYVWPRDASVSAHALDRAGYFDTTERFFRFLAQLLEKDGYLMHKYRVDGVLGSSWHPWVRSGDVELPIQEDEIALPIYMLGCHYARVKDLEFIEALYNPFIEPAADFMTRYIDAETGLPAYSYDLWEEKFGSSTYTAAAVYGALQSAAELSAILGKRDNARKYRDQAEHIKSAILTHLYSPDTKTFLKLLRREQGKLVRDTTLDASSLHGMVSFGVLDVYDARVRGMVDAIETRLRVPTENGGYVRYEGDRYFKVGEEAYSNPWCITTLWMAQYYIKVARTKKDLARAYDMLVWTKNRATTSGILPEQLNPYTGAHLSVAPLVWSHAEYIITVDDYQKRFTELK
jgi:oligosaccharide amylase